MSEQPESSPTKKRRVIHWDPEHGRATTGRRWTALRIAAWSVGGLFALLVVAGIAIRGIRLLIAPQFLQPAHAVVESGGSESAGTTFVSESKAGLARENATKAMGELRRLPQDHPAQLEQMILIEKSFIVAEALMEARDYSRAFEQFTALNREIDAFGQNVKLKQETQKAYDVILVRMKELDRARSLAPEEFESAFASAGAGRQFFINGRFAVAKKQYDAAFAALTRAELALKNYVDKNMNLALEAVAQGRKDDALAGFHAVLEKDPSSDLATQGLKRAAVADRVHALLLQGAAFEEKKEYAKAHEAFGKAFGLDAFSATAQQGQARNERLEKESAFAEALAQATDYRSRQDWPKAIEAYGRALKIYPQKDTVKKDLAETKEIAHREAVKKALASAVDYENKYEWEQARAAYNATIELDAGQADAKEGYVRTGRMIRTIMQYNKLVEQAENSAQHAEFQLAIRAFNEAMSVKPSYLALTDRIDQLRLLLRAQSQPVQVTFTSDGDSWVSISNFRMLGKIKSETVKILPGDYEIVSRRKGYQNVLLMLQVRAGNTPPVVNVACTLRADS